MFGHGFPHYPGRGLTQLLILRIIYEKPTHGYQIMGDLKRMTSGRYEPESGSVYTILRRLEEKGFLISKWESKKAGADRRVYNLTDDGVKLLKEGLEVVKKRRSLADELIRFYEVHFNDEDK